jgi:hypothetical protein
MQWTKAWPAEDGYYWVRSLGDGEITAALIYRPYMQALGWNHGEELHKDMPSDIEGIEFGDRISIPSQEEP